jgi:hypothetical protein
MTLLKRYFFIGRESNQINTVRHSFGKAEFSFAEPALIGGLVRLGGLGCNSALYTIEFAIQFQNALVFWQKSFSEGRSCGY